MRKVMVFGSFDVLHDGHRSFFRQARRHGDVLTVVVARDQTYERLRGYAPVHDERERLKGVREESLVDAAVLGELRDPYRVLRTHRPDVVCLGYDQEAFVGGLRERLDASGLKDTVVIRLDPYRPDRYKSSLLKGDG